MPIHWRATIVMRSLIRHWRLHALSGISIVLGMTIFILGTSAINGLDEQIIRDQERVVGGDIRFHSSTAPNASQRRELRRITPEIRESLKHLEIESWTGRSIFMAQLLTATDAPFIRVLGYNPKTDQDVFPRTDWHIVGHEPDSSDEIAVSSLLAHSLKIQIGDHLTIRTRTVNGAQNAVDYRCTAIIQTKVMALDKAVVWLPLSAVKTLLQTEDIFSHISLRLSGGRATSRSFLPPKELSDWIAFSAETEVESHLALNRFRRQAIGMISIVLLLIASIGLCNTMVMICFQRKREIGVLWAIGVSPLRILVLYSLEGFAVGLLSSLIACLLGGGLSYFYSQEGLALAELSSQAATVAIPPILYTEFSVPLLLLVSMLCSLLGLLTALLPISYLLRGDILSLLRSE